MLDCCLPTRKRDDDCCVWLWLWLCRLSFVVCRLSFVVCRLSFVVCLVFAVPYVGESQVCDKALRFVGLKPAICNSPMCMFAYEQNGLGLDVASELRTNPKVSDLLISMFYSIAQNDARLELCFPDTVRGALELSGAILGWRLPGPVSCADC